MGRKESNKQNTASLRFGVSPSVNIEKEWHIKLSIMLKCMVMVLNILLNSKINISLCTYLFFIDHPLICLVNYGSVHCLNLNIWGLPYYSKGD